MGFGLLAEDQPQEGFEKSLAAIFGVVNELEEAKVERKTLLGDAAVRPEPRAQQGPEALDGVDVNLVEAVAVFIAGILPSAVADGLVLVAPLRQTAVDVILVGQHEGARRDGRLDQRLYRDLADVFEHADDDLAAALHHAEDWRLFLRQRAPTRGALQAVSAALPVFFLPPKDVPCDPPRHRPHHTPRFLRGQQRACDGRPLPGVGSPSSERRPCSGPVPWRFACSTSSTP